MTASENMVPVFCLLQSVNTLWWSVSSAFFFIQVWFLLLLVSRLASYLALPTPTPPKPPPPPPPYSPTLASNALGIDLFITNFCIDLSGSSVRVESWYLTDPAAMHYSSLLLHLSFPTPQSFPLYIPSLRTPPPFPQYSSPSPTTSCLALLV